MVDAHALGACGLGRAGSNPASPTIGVPRCLMVGNNASRMVTFTAYR